MAPGGLRLAVARARRAWRDAGLAGARPRLAGRIDASPAGFPHQLVEIAQEVKGGALLEGKLANIRLGAARLDGAVVAPGETLSFWKLVGRPLAGAGFEVGRSIRGGAVAGEIGGGLCQVSGILYEAGLRAGLVPAERHPHSRDLYAEEERFTPLGMDATVVWPWKDLRLLNPHAVPVQFGLVVRDLVLAISVRAPVPLARAAIEIERTDHADRRDVRVVRRIAGEAELISDDVYAVMAGGGA
jgi:vancomycin resistance protein VanW